MNQIATSFQNHAEKTGNLEVKDYGVPEDSVQEESLSFQ
jgi:hypothetical protein